MSQDAQSDLVLAEIRKHFQLLHDAVAKLQGAVAKLQGAVVTLDSKLETTVEVLNKKIDYNFALVNSKIENITQNDLTRVVQKVKNNNA